mgnify:CR=1 FL=1
MKKKNFMDRMTDVVIDKLAGPMGKFASLKPMLVIKDGLVAITPVILVGSLFLLIQLLGQPVIGGSGKPLIPALAPFAEKIGLVNSLTMGFMSFYAAIAFSVCYARVYKLDQLTMAIMGASAFMLINIDKVSDGAIQVGNFGAAGIFAAMVTVFASGWIYRFCTRKNLVIKMPEGVPQGVGNAFTSLIPFAIVFVIAWAVRTLMGIDLSSVFTMIFSPIFKAADNIGLFTLRCFISQTFWGVGIHGDNILAPVLGPLNLLWIGENNKAAMAGVALTQLPHIWTEATERCVLFTSSEWGLLFWMYFSKKKSTKAMAVACTPSAIFCIIEPLVFGLPIVMNPILIIPWILSATIAGFVGYGIFALGLCNRFFVLMPWATPPPILAFLGTGGDWRAILVVIVSFLIGVIVYYPFVKAWERQEDNEIAGAVTTEGTDTSSN